MNHRPGMSCSDNRLTDDGMAAASSNDDRIDPYCAAELMGWAAWVDYVTRWQPMRWIRERRERKERSA